MATLSRDDNRFDILRLLAAWLVLYNHCYPLGAWPHGELFASTLGIDTLGGVGVAIFFVLSGYLVAQSIERSRNVLDFARRRALRIYPALIVVTLLCMLVLGPAVTTLPLPEYFRHEMTWRFLWTASAWRLEYPLPGVFANNPVPNAVNGSLWSLPYEVRCYVALAVASLLPFALRWKALLALVVFTGVLLLRPHDVSQFTKFARMDYFMTKLSMLFSLGVCWAAWADRFRPRLWLGLPLTLIALFLPLWAPDLLMPLGMPRLVMFELGFGTTVLWLALNARWLPRIPPRWGDWSYGAYLYAFPVQQVLALLRLHELSFPGYVLACTLVTALLAGLSWHFVEKPALRWKEGFLAGLPGRSRRAQA